MKAKNLGLLVACALGLVAACKDDPKPAPPASTSAAVKAPAASTAAAPKPSAAAPKPSAAPKASVAHKKVPAPPADKGIKPLEIPADWITLEQPAKGYSFKMPASAKGEGKTHGDMDIFMAHVDKPFNFGTFVTAFKKQGMTKDQLFKVAEELIADKDLAHGTDIKQVDHWDVDKDHAVAHYTWKEKDGLQHARVLVVTDVTDKYIMIVGTSEKEWKANQPTIDAVWMSFDMWSGGASGENAE